MIKCQCWFTMRFLILFALLFSGFILKAKELERRVIRKQLDFDSAALPALVPSAPDGEVMIFRYSEGISMRIKSSPGRNKITIAYVSGPTFPPLKIAVDRKDIGSTTADKQNQLKTISCVTPVLPGTYQLAITPERRGDIAIKSISVTSADFFPVPDSCWKRTSPNERSTFFYHPCKFNNYSFRLKADAPAELEIDGKKVIVLKKPGQAAEEMTWNTFKSPVSPVRIRCKGKFTLETSEPGGTKFLKSPPEFSLPGKNYSAWPRAEISNGIISTKVAIPDNVSGFYRGGRFDPSGMVTSLKYQGHEYFTSQHPPSEHNPTRLDDVAGNADEFSIPIAYEDAEVGQAFIKVGVGTFIKPLEYKPFFNNLYWPQQRFKWKTKAEKDSITFTQNAKGPRGWAYRLTKTVRLTPGKPELTVACVFENTGQKHILTNQYAHNFILIDRIPVKKGNYTVTFNYQADYKKYKVMRRRFKLKGRTAVLSGKTLFSELSGFTGSKNNYADVRHIPSGRGVIVSGDFAPADMRIFSTSKAVCPEVFKRIDLAPGQSCQWTRTYRMY